MAGAGALEIRLPNGAQVRVEGALQLTAAQLALLLEGIDWHRTVAPPQTERPRVA